MDAQITGYVVLAASERDDLRHFNELISSWPVQLLVLGLYLGLVVLAFTRGARDWEAGPRRRFRVSLVALGVFLVLDVVFASGAFGWNVVPAWTQTHFVQVPLFLWLFGMWLYYMARFMTATRPGPGDPEARLRGATLEGSLGGALDEQRDGGPVPRAPA